MKKQIRLLTAAALCANLAFAGAAPGFAAEAAAPAAETESALQAGQELAGEVLNAANEAWKFSGTMEFGDGLLSLMSSDGTDVSWLKSAGVEGVVAGGGDGTADANETISLNGTAVCDVQAKYDAESGRLYFSCPDLKKGPASVDLNKIFSGMKSEFQSGFGSGLETGIPSEDMTRLQKEAAELFGSISSDEWTDFIGRYAGTVMAGVKTEQEGESQVTAGSLSDTVTRTTVSIQPDAMDKIVKDSVGTLREDPLVLKILGSDFAADLVSMAVKSGSDKTSDAGTDSTGSVTGSQLVEMYQSALDSAKDNLSGLPGFSVSVGNNAEGKFTSMDLKVLYSGVEIPVCTFVTITDGTKNATELDLGEMIASSLLGAASGEGQSDVETETGAQDTASSGKTGLLMEGTTDGGKLNETMTIQAAGTPYATVTVSDWDIKGMKSGKFAGSVLAQLGGESVGLDFAQSDAEGQSVSLLVNGEMFVKVTGSVGTADPSSVQKLDTTGAVELKSSDDFEKYLADADPSGLREKLQAAGVPQELLGSETEQAAGAAA